MEEARPIQLAQKGPNARNLAGVTGMVDDGEHSLDTARREIQEEL
ncbi:MAG: NUDIX domain-containing protein [Patescibacteria group bacterium]|nr:NUDIX domain-containing protein [Patescibacteria group bacterium]